MHDDLKKNNNNHKNSSLMKSELAIMTLGQPGGTLDDEIYKSGEL